MNPLHKIRARLGKESNLGVFVENEELRELDEYIKRLEGAIDAMKMIINLGPDGTKQLIEKFKALAEKPKCERCGDAKRVDKSPEEINNTPFGGRLTKPCPRCGGGE